MKDVNRISLAFFPANTNYLVPDDMTPTPKTAFVGGVKFVRSRNGNLYRSRLVKEKGFVLAVQTSRNICFKSPQSNS